MLVIFPLARDKNLFEGCQKILYAGKKSVLDMVRYGSESECIHIQKMESGDDAKVLKIYKIIKLTVSTDYSLIYCMSHRPHSLV